MALLLFRLEQNRDVSGKDQDFTVLDTAQTFNKRRFLLQTLEFQQLTRQTGCRNRGVSGSEMAMFDVTQSRHSTPN